MLRPDQRIVGRPHLIVSAGYLRRKKWIAADSNRLFASGNGAALAKRNLVLSDGDSTWQHLQGCPVVRAERFSQFGLPDIRPQLFENDKSRKIAAVSI